MRKKELKLIVTFHTTADAMAMEKCCKEHQVPGRLNSGYRGKSQLGAELSWCADLKETRKRCRR